MSENRRYAGGIDDFRRLGGSRTTVTADEKRTVVVFHDTYGCDTGCCGHSIKIDGNDEWFDFDHPGLEEPYIDFARRFVRKALGEEHVADLDWDNCIISDF